MLSELLTNSFCGSVTLLLMIMSISRSHSLPITVEVPVPTTPFTGDETATESFHLPSSELLNNIDFGNKVRVCVLKASTRSKAKLTLKKIAKLEFLLTFFLFIFYFFQLKPVKPSATNRKSEFLTIPIPSLATVLTAYDAKEKFVLDFLNVNVSILVRKSNILRLTFLTSPLKATPLIDGIAEKDKYGNTGDFLYPVTRALVDNVQTFSNVWAKAAEVPLQLLKKFTRKTSEQLNEFGARLVGLK
jgi:hypothetical protein